MRSLSLAPQLKELGQVRSFVGEIAVEAGFQPEKVFDIKLACSEAIANAIEHAQEDGGVEVITLLYPDRLEVQIEGPGKFQPPQTASKYPHRGLGLPLMASLADYLALYSGPRGGTLVSLTFYRPGAKKPEEKEPLPPSIRQLIQENEFVSAITQNAPIGIFVLGSDLRYRWANQAYHALLEEPYRSGNRLDYTWRKWSSGRGKPASVRICRSCPGQRSPFSTLNTI